MAEAVLEVALENLNSLIQKELGLFLGVDRDMERLSSTLTTIRAVLEDAEEKQLTNRALKNWLHKLKDAARLLDDILDECATEALRLEYQGVNFESANKVGGSCLSSFHPKHALFRYKIAKKMQGIRERLDEIAEERIKFHLQETVTGRITEVMEWRQTTSLITQPQVYGRGEDKEKIVDFLVNHASDCDDLTVYPIIGIGGLGKTTLVQIVFNDERIVNHFERKFWVCVSEDFSLKRMLKAIIELAFEQVCEDLDLELLQRKLQELLQRKRYLLVLDDVWNDNQEKWDKLKSVLDCGSKGSSVLVTTRLMKVASIMGTISPHQLSMLSEEHCWELFRQRAFGEDRGEHAELVALGKEIVEKCKGVPLAAKALGSLLHFKSEEKDWLNVKESEIWNLPQDEHSILPALRLSYLNLPTKTRQCFAYCALFPKDHKMSKELVIELWMANGFISSNDRLEVEDVGDEVWNELYLRSFFQDIAIDSSDTRFKMHDLIHDLAQSVIEEECCCITTHNDTTNLSKRTRHLSIYCHWQHFSSQLHQVKTLKTYISSDWHLEEAEILMKFDSLRVLEISAVSLIPSSIAHFKHLRYLKLSRCGFKTLPNSITRLWNLQILNLNYCCNLQKLPDGLKCLKFLRHLHLEGCRSLLRLAPEIGKLNFLRTLNIYIVSKQRGFLLAELGCLNLKGKLHIKHLERVRSVLDAKEANMASKHLNNLLLSWERNEESQSQENVEQILEVLHPHTQKLQTLGVGGYMGVDYPQWMGSPSLKDLFYIELVDCKSCLRLPLLGNLPSLKILKLYNMNHVQYVDDDKSYNGGVAKGFKALEFLVLEKLPSLIRLSIEDGENMFPCLSKFQITDCPKLSLPCLPSIIEIRIVKEHNQALLGSIQNLRSLESLWLLNGKELTSFPDGMLYGLTCLKKLHILGHEKLELLPTELNNLNALEELHIDRCNKLEPLTEQVLQGLNSLKRLTINRYPKFQLSTGFQYLTSLEDLTIAGCQELERFPETLQYITTLQSLSLYDLPNLMSLPIWLGNLRSLQSLFISECHKLMSIPMSIQCLDSLKILQIFSCPKLLQRYEKETGKDWHIVAHVPRIILEKVEIRPTQLRVPFRSHMITELLSAYA